MPTDLDSGDAQLFSATVGLLYVFNLIVGTGALALPKAFQTTGYVLSVVLLIISAFSSYICATFIIECLGIANAVIKLSPKFQNKTRRRTLSINGCQFSSSRDSLVSNVRIGTLPFKITHLVEVSAMSHIFLCNVGVFFTYLALSVYLFGDLTIYSTTVPKSLMNVLCSSLNHNETLVPVKYLPCHANSPIFPTFVTRFFVYRFCVFTFAAFCFLMVLVGITRTKYIQLATTVSRWIAFSLMIIFATVQLVQKGPQSTPPATNFHSFSSFFGVAVYAFMCHHSIPGLVFPIKNTNYINYRLTVVYAIIFCFYCTLSLTGSFAFSVVQDVYTLNFFHDDQTGSLFYVLVDYFLASFPVFTLTSSYIIVAITLTNNIKVLIKMTSNALNARPIARRTHTDLTSCTDILIGEDYVNLRNTESQELLNEISSLSSEDEFNAQSPQLDSSSQIVEGDTTIGETVNDAPSFQNLPLSPVNQTCRSAQLYNQSRERRRQRSSLLQCYSGSNSFGATDNDDLCVTETVESRQSFIWHRLALPVVVIALPTLLSFFTDNVLLLASITGTYPGVGVQFIIPSILVINARNFLQQHFVSLDVPVESCSPFRHWVWPYVTIGWAVFAVFVVSANILHLG